MSHLPDPLIRLIEELQRLPGIGPKGAQRLAFHLLKTPRETTDRLVDAVRDVKELVTYCSSCNNITAVDSSHDRFCSNVSRNVRWVAENVNATRSPLASIFCACATTML